MLIKITFSLLLIIMCSACARIGPDVIQAGGNDYNIAIQQTNNEQLLLNLIRLKYRDTPYFLEVNSVSSQFRLATQAGVSANFKEQQIPENVGISGSLSFTEQPTVTYLPLHGNDFIQRLLAPISINTIVLLVNSGWSVERIMRMTLQSINGVPNAPTASGPTPESAPEFKAFLEIARAMRELQNAGALQLGYNKAGDNEATLLLTDTSNLNTDVLHQSLKLKKQSSYRLVSGSDRIDTGESMVLNTRSLLGVMYYLSHSVNVPEKDKKDGKVTLTYDSSGTEFNWSDLTRGLFDIKSSAEIKSNFAISTRYRNNWFYIDDTDLDSKTTFSLLTQLFSLQSGKAEGITPVLTLPIGQ